MHDYHIDSHPEKEQDERDKLVANWIICVDCEKCINDYQSFFQIHILFGSLFGQTGSF
ncbi:hypothetical protein RhiirA4_482423 [Rhizophagus irregularis]|uniref:Uncharacterized protein n=1 Tax=Rhizophagus irregularis TaxID=588596 RepID=A0A2I1HL25_9GLOM|nr:hypothetical protein RhiirA4_482423 [Rhizophagus irregularis]